MASGVLMWGRGGGSAGGGRGSLRLGVGGGSKNIASESVWWVENEWVTERHSSEGIRNFLKKREGWTSSGGETIRRLMGAKNLIWISE